MNKHDHNIDCVKEFLAECKNSNMSHKPTWILAALTDEYILDIWPDMTSTYLDGKEDKVLEIRIFNADEERKLVRTDIGKDFYVRTIRDPQDKYESFDEEQYLDIDTSIPQDERGFVTATGGGRYHLPVKSSINVKVKIRYYLDRYEETGQAIVADWRPVELIEDKAYGKEKI